MRITPTSRPSNDASLDMGVPPRPSRLYGRSGRAALTAGTLTPVGDDVAREDGERYVVLRDANRNDADDVKHAVNYGDNPQRTWERGVAKGARDAARRLEYIRSRLVTAHDFTEHEALRQGRLRRWQTIR